MPRFSPFAVGAWLAATTVATAVSWAGVGAVTRAVAGSPDHVIPTGRLDAAPASALAGTVSDLAIIAATRTASTSAVGLAEAVTGITITGGN